MSSDLNQRSFCKSKNSLGNVKIILADRTTEVYFSAPCVTQALNRGTYVI